MADPAAKRKARRQDVSESELEADCADAEMPAGEHDMGEPSDSKGKGGCKGKGHRGSGRSTKVIFGKKICSCCGKIKALSEFKGNASACAQPCRRALDNTRTACEKQGQMEWYKEQVKTPAGQLRLVHVYNQKCGNAAEGKRPPPFPVLQYRQQLRVAEEQLRDGVFELMHEIAFVEWAKKPKHCPPNGMAMDDAKIEFVRRSKEGDAIVDFNGPTEQYRMRIAVMVNTLMTFRSSYSKSQGYNLADKENKKAVQTDLDNAHRRALSDMESAHMPTTEMNKRELAQQLASSGSAQGGAFAGDQFNLRGIREQLEEQAESKSKDLESGEDDEADPGGDDDNGPPTPTKRKADQPQGCPPSGNN